MNKFQHSCLPWGITGALNLRRLKMYELFQQRLREWRQEFGKGWSLVLYEELQKAMSNMLSSRTSILFVTEVNWQTFFFDIRHSSTFTEFTKICEHFDFITFSHVWFLLVLCKFESGSGTHRRYSESLRTGRPGDQIPVLTRISAHVRTGLGAHPASYSMGTGSLLPRLKRPGRGVDHVPYLGPRLKKEWRYFSTPPPDLHGLYMVNFTFTFFKYELYQHFLQSSVCVCVCVCVWRA